MCGRSGARWLSGKRRSERADGRAHGPDPRRQQARPGVGSARPLPVGLRHANRQQRCSADVGTCPKCPRNQERSASSGSGWSAAPVPAGSSDRREGPPGGCSRRRRSGRAGSASAPTGWRPPAWGSAPPAAGRPARGESRVDGLERQAGHGLPEACVELLGGRMVGLLQGAEDGHPLSRDLAPPSPKRRQRPIRREPIHPHPATSLRPPARYALRDGLSRLGCRPVERRALDTIVELATLQSGIG